MSFFQIVIGLIRFSIKGQSLILFGSLQMHFTICFHLKEVCNAKHAFNGKTMILRVQMLYNLS